MGGCLGCVQNCVQNVCLPLFLLFLRCASSLFLYGISLCLPHTTMLHCRYWHPPDYDPQKDGSLDKVHVFLCLRQTVSGVVYFCALSTLPLLLCLSLGSPITLWISTQTECCSSGWLCVPWPQMYDRHVPISYHPCALIRTFLCCPAVQQFAWVTGGQVTQAGPRDFDHPI